MSLKDKIVFEPVRSLSGLLALGAATILAAAYGLDWSGEAVGLVSGVWSAFIAFVGTFFVRDAVTPNAAVNQKVHDTIVALDAAKPDVVVVVPPPADPDA